MIDYPGGIAKRIADLKAKIIGVLYRIVFDRLPFVDMGDDRYRLSGFLPGGGNRLVGGQIPHKTNQYRDGCEYEDQYDDM
jgi:hypothetical protein